MNTKEDWSTLGYAPKTRKILAFNPFYHHGYAIVRWTNAGWVTNEGVSVAPVFWKELPLLPPMKIPHRIKKACDALWETFDGTASVEQGSGHTVYADECIYSPCGKVADVKEAYDEAKEDAVLNCPCHVCEVCRAINEMVAATI